MKLSDIIRTKFLPPISFDDNDVEMFFGIEKLATGFGAFVQNVSSQIKFWANSDDHRFFNSSLKKIILPTEEKAKEACWNHFQSNIMYYTPKGSL